MGYPPRTKRANDCQFTAALAQLQGTSYNSFLKSPSLFLELRRREQSEQLTKERLWDIVHVLHGNVTLDSGVVRHLELDLHGKLSLPACRLLSIRGSVEGGPFPSSTKREAFSVNKDQEKH